MGVPPLPGLRPISLTSAFPGFSSVITGMRVLYEPEIRSQIIAGFPSKHRKKLKNILPVWWLLPLLGDSRSLCRRFSVLRSITVMPCTKEKARSESGIQICPTNNRGSASLKLHHISARVKSSSFCVFQPSTFCMRIFLVFVVFMENPINYTFFKFQKTTFYSKRGKSLIKLSCTLLQYCKNL